MIFSTLIVVIKDEHKKWKSLYMWSAVIHTKNVYLVEINGQIVNGKWWSCNEWRECEDMSKCCWSFSEGRVNVDDKQSGQLNSWSVKTSSIFHTVPILHQVIITCFSTLKSFWLPSLRIDQETEDVVQDWLRGLVATFLDEGIQKLFPVWHCHNYIITMWRSSLLYVPKCCSKNIF